MFELNLAFVKKSRATTALALNEVKTLSHLLPITIADVICLVKCSRLSIV
jgi:hypothetical protein